MAKLLTDRIAMVESPFSLVFEPDLSNITAAIVVVNKVKVKSLVRFKTAAIAIDPNATWESPSPIKENLLKTKITPNRAAERAIRTPTMRAYLTKG